MPIFYDDEAGMLAVLSEYCGDCEAALYDTGCDAPGCRGYCCFGCGTGCDIEVDPEGGRCATALDPRPCGERVNVQRAP